MNHTIQKEIEIAKNGGIVIFPTDTAFGLGCRIDREDSIKRLFTIRNRPLDKAVPVLFDSLEMVKKYTVDISDDVTKHLITPYWPGALTIILKANENRVPKLVSGVSGKESTIGVRIPNNKEIVSLIQAVGVPFIGTSANFSGQPTPYSLLEIDPALREMVDGIIDGECSLKKESTVIDTTVTPWKVVRQGAVVI